MLDKHLILVLPLLVIIIVRRTIRSNGTLPTCVIHLQILQPSLHLIRHGHRLLLLIQLQRIHLTSIPFISFTPLSLLLILGTRPQLVILAQLLALRLLLHLPAVLVHDVLHVEPPIAEHRLEPLVDLDLLLGARDALEARIVDQVGEPLVGPDLRRAAAVGAILCHGHGRTSFARRLRFVLFGFGHRGMRWG